MGEVHSEALTEEERAELEALRAEKAARERAELEALRAERRQTASRAAAGEDREELRRIAEARERGERLMVPDEESLAMPLGQKIVLAVIAIMVVVALIMLLAPKA